MNVVGDVDVRGFDAFVSEATKSLDAAQESKLVRALAMRFIELVVPRTPVDTGRVRAGWTMTRAREGYGQLKRGGLFTGTSFELFNGVPYVAYLELGSSRQAPSGFVRRTLREMTGEAAKEGERRTEAALRLANMRARAQVGLKQGLGTRNYGGRANIARR